MLSCPMCGADPTGDPVVGREMLLGLRESFEYRRCSSCGSLWLPEPPADLGRYYGGEYYRATPEPPPAPLARQRARVALRLPPRLARGIAETVGGLPLPSYLAGLGLRPASRIADVGAGQGSMLRNLQRLGFRDLWGFDPYAPVEADEPGLRLVSSTIAAAPTGFDLIMYHHSLEHVRDPARELADAAARLADGGRILVRVPVAGSYADRMYGADWVALDPPRHLFVPTAAGMRALARGARLEVRRVQYDSQPMQLWGSEQYRRDIPLRDPRSHAVAPERSVFAAADIAFFARATRWLNRHGDGDAAAFLLAPAPPAP